MIVFPVIGIIITAKPKYKIGIFTSPNNGKAKFVSKVPSKRIGVVHNANAIGLNHPPITRLSSIIPTTNASNVVIKIASISEVGINA